jgi:hypothetical protein
MIMIIIPFYVDSFFFARPLSHILFCRRLPLLEYSMFGIIYEIRNALNQEVSLFVFANPDSNVQIFLWSIYYGNRG